jgi:hypothetical protein
MFFCLNCQIRDNTNPTIYYLTDVLLKFKDK